MSKWLSHIKTVFNNKRKTNKSYTYKAAMKDAAKTYKSNAVKSVKKGKSRTRRNR